MSVKSVHPMPGNSSRKRPRTYNDSNIESRPIKHFKDVSGRYAVSRPFKVCSTDQCVPSFGAELEIYSDGLQVDFYADPCSVDKKTEEKECSRLEEHPFGSFALLPPEIFHLVLSLLEISALNALARTSAGMCAAVCGYVYTPAGLKSVLPQYSEGDFAEPMEFNRLGTVYDVQIKDSVHFLAFRKV